MIPVNDGFVTIVAWERCEVSNSFQSCKVSQWSGSMDRKQENNTRTERMGCLCDNCTYQEGNTLEENV